MAAQPDGRGARFIFGINAMPNLVETADKLPEDRCGPFLRPAKYEVKTEPKCHPANIKEQIVIQRQYENIRLQSQEDFLAFSASVV